MLFERDLDILAKANVGAQAPKQRAFEKTRQPNTWIQITMNKFFNWIQIELHNKNKKFIILQ